MFRGCKIFPEFPNKYHHTITKTIILRNILVEGHGDDPTFLFRDTLLISLHKFADVALYLMTLPKHAH
jgi:hypothetical protein